jgi:hypothetical protein
MLKGSNLVRQSGARGPKARLKRSEIWMGIGPAHWTVRGEAGIFINQLPVDFALAAAG